MVTALALQLIQCVVKLPSHINGDQLPSQDLDELGLIKKKNDFVRPFITLLNFILGTLYWLHVLES